MKTSISFFKLVLAPSGCHFEIEARVGPFKEGLEGPRTSWPSWMESRFFLSMLIFISESTIEGEEGVGGVVR